MRDEGRWHEVRRIRIFKKLSSSLLATGVLLAVLASAGPASAQDPLITGAGDIACDPNSSYFRNGSGTGANCRQLATSRLLSDANAVFTLGDNNTSTAASPSSS